MSRRINPTEMLGMNDPSMALETHSAEEDNWYNWQMETAPTFTDTNMDTSWPEALHEDTFSTVMNQPLHAPYDYGHGVFDSSMTSRHASYTPYYPQNPDPSWGYANSVDGRHSAPFVDHVPTTGVHTTSRQMTIDTNVSRSFALNDISPSVGTPSSYTPSPSHYQPVRMSQATKSASKAQRANPENRGNFICEIYFDDFTRKCNLNAHIRSHLGQKPFRCAQCHRGFGTKSVLTCHERTLHPNRG
ncbi:hypothetical protein JAAARDRAFT_209462 [Jaapia argillacea MUCL 33604]|uniref:C2H2-type domain-containing protein n=1 Tax=Jaapia argillacea MUCL 33604 TaxID=933084 RepID=A0A067PHT3_9AGAM|nr:hypothetical protein JAAARDRAFT_209462 [Jaapia argillacea MUCL 33604]